MDVIIVGAGFFGITVAERLASAGYKVIVLEKRNHIGGNCYSEIDVDTGIECHKYGSHIFHTSNERVWSYINQFSKFNNYRHTVWTTLKDRVYSMPINLATINAFYSMNLKPFQAKQFILDEIAKDRIKQPRNFQEKGISLIGRPLYSAFIRGYTLKQWEQDPNELAPEIISRLPVRYNYNNRYFNDKYEGIPLEGYRKLFDRMIDQKNIELRLNVDYFQVKNQTDARLTVFTGPIDRFFNYKYGCLDWRTLYFEIEHYDFPDYQGCPVMNYAEESVPYTRVHEFKHFHPERKQLNKTIIYKEFSRISNNSDDPYYPVNTLRNRKILEMYQTEAKKTPNVKFGGRLGEYRYLDMDATIAAALELADRIMNGE